MTTHEGSRQADPVIPDVLPLLPIKDLVVFPYMIVPLRVTRPVSMEAVAKALEADERLCFLVAQRDPLEDEPTAQGFYRAGTIGMIMRMRKLSEGGLKVLVQGLCRARIQKFVGEKPCYRVRLDRSDDKPPARSLGIEALLRSVRGNIDKLSGLGKTIQPELSMVVQSVDDPGRMADLVASHLTLKVPEAQELLELDESVQRLTRVNQTLEKEIGILEVQSQIQNRAKRGDVEDPARLLPARAAAADQARARRQRRARRGDGGAARQGDAGGAPRGGARRGREAGAAPRSDARRERRGRRPAHLHRVAHRAPLERLQRGDRSTSQTARKILDEDHYDLEQVKDRILDYLAVRKLRGGAHGPILCFLGPPGVGKTSLGRSIARALGRKFVRISLGGVRDEAEIRGHRRTYVGALPGRVIQALKQAGTNNPVLLLDEVDKLGADNRGDPSAALLEVLDPEQNHTFRDHYLGVSFDLSKVVFIATANQPETIPPPLRDRMETIRLSGYAEEEKLAIAERYIIPKQITEAGLTANEIVISREVTRRIVSEYTRESGLRELERLIAHLARKIARRVVEEAARASGSGATGVLNPRAPTIGIEEVPTFLGPPRYLPEERHRVAEIGTVNGLAWTPYGGEVLLIEAQTMAGKGSLILTGQLGDVMKESAQAALSFARAHALALGLASEFYAGREIHIHVPAGGVPKDGPSAGVTMACALVSLIAGIPVRHDVAMTGELTLRGKVLPIGGLKEKLLAAARAGITTVIIPAANASDLTEIPSYITDKLAVRPVRTMHEVLEIALARPLSPPATKKATGTAAGAGTTKGERGRERRKVTSRPGMA